LFCEVREASMHPLCGFYAAAIEHVLARFALRADAKVSECRAAVTRPAKAAAARGAAERCLLSVVVQGARADEPAAAA
jgi:hypothetical protein